MIGKKLRAVFDRAMSNVYGNPIFPTLPCDGGDSQYKQLKTLQSHSKIEFSLERKRIFA